jgi:hypothetical protein
MSKIKEALAVLAIRILAYKLYDKEKSIERAYQFIIKEFIKMLPPPKKCTLVGKGEKCGDDMHLTAIDNYNQCLKDIKMKLER